MAAHSAAVVVAPVKARLLAFSVIHQKHRYSIRETALAIAATTCL
jgi:hypothetical protein